MPRKWYLLHRDRDGYPPLREEIRAEKLMMRGYSDCRYHLTFQHVVRNPRMKPLLHRGGKHA